MKDFYELKKRKDIVLKELLDYYLGSYTYNESESTLFAAFIARLDYEGKLEAAVLDLNDQIRKEVKEISESLNFALDNEGNIVQNNSASRDITSIESLWDIRAFRQFLTKEGLINASIPKVTIKTILNTILCSCDELLYSISGGIFHDESEDFEVYLFRLLNLVSMFINEESMLICNDEKTYGLVINKQTLESFINNKEETLDKISYTYRKIQINNLSNVVMINFNEDVNSNMFQSIYIKDKRIIVIFKEDAFINITSFNLALDIYKKNEKPKILWSKAKKILINFKEDYVMHQLLTRYGMFDRPYHGLANVIIDSFVPRILYASKFNLNNARILLNKNKSMVAISPWFANLFNVKQMETEQMCRMLGYDKKRLVNIINKVKNRQLNVVFVGTGGTGLNTLHWLDEISKFTNTINYFKNTYVFEPERYDISNLLRYPIDASGALLDSTGAGSYYYRFESTKIALAAPKLDRISKNKAKLIYNKLDEKTMRYGYAAGLLHKVDDKYTVKETFKGKVIAYGAPSLEAREYISSIMPFISATHSDNGCRLDINPTQDTDIQVESYGMIQLGSFFMNQLHMAISFLEFLSDSSNDFYEPNKNLMKFSFNGKSKLTTDRLYNFQIAEDLDMMTEEEAEGIINV